MPRKPKPPPDNPEQFKRFTDLAREVEADTDPETLGRVFDKVAHPKREPLSLRLAVLVAAGSQLHHEAFDGNKYVLGFVVSVFVLDENVATTTTRNPVADRTPTRAMRLLQRRAI